MLLDAAVPPVPPRPYSVNSRERESSLPPPIPPLPSNFCPDTDDQQFPHLADPLVAPRPHRINPDLPADMARTLDEHAAYNGARLTTPQPPPAVNYAPGFMIPGAQPYASPPSGVCFSSLPMPQIHSDDGRLSASMGGLSVNDEYQSRQMALSTASPPLPMPLISETTVSGLSLSSQSQRAWALSTSGPPQSFNSTASPMPQFPGSSLSMSGGAQPRAPAPSSPPRSCGPPSLTATLPTIPSLQSALPSVCSANADLSSKVAWIRDVLLLVNRSSVVAQGSSASSGSPTGADPPTGPVHISDPALQRLADTAVPLLLSLAPSNPAPGQKLSPVAAEALFLRATLTSAGSFPAHVPHNQRTAFREFEAAARAGHHAAWFRLGRDYETFNDAPHAKECFERGAKSRDESCTYRLGMAHLMGQLGLPVNPQQAIPLLHLSATLATVAAPQPAYVFALLLLNEFKSLSVALAPSDFAQCIPAGSTPALEARRHLERAAYLHFSPAQYKLGHAYEFAEAPFPFDPLLSVQYYSLASQQGEAEADVALSKWFLCGAEDVAEGGFAKDEKLAYTFAEKAARKGLSSGEFAMGYYFEVGIGTSKDLEKAIGWYEKASAHGNSDAAQRIAALSQSATQALSRQEHAVLAENKLVRKRTQAKARSAAVGAGAVHPSTRPDADQLVDIIRRSSHAQAQSHPRHSSPASSGQPNFNPGPYRTSDPQPHQAPSMPSISPQQPHTAQYPPHSIGSTSVRFPERQRYSLTDTGAVPAQPTSAAAGSPKLQPTRPGRGGARVSSGTGTGAQMPPLMSSSPKQDAASLPASAAAPAANLPMPSVAANPTANSGTKYHTFADMGIQGQRAEDKECVIM